MARLFDGSANRMATGYTTSSTTRSYAFWIMRTDAFALASRFFTKDDQAELVYCGQLTPVAIEYMRTWGGGAHNGRWWSPTGVLALNTWEHWIVTYDGSSSSNKPKMYQNGVSQTISTVANPSTTLDSNANQFYLANNSAANRGFKGRMAEVALWNDVLTDAEAQMVYRTGPTSRVSNLVLYYPLWGLSTTEADLSVTKSNGTITGATLADHPPVGLYSWRFGRGAYIYPNAASWSITDSVALADVIADLISQATVTDSTTLADSVPAQADQYWPLTDTIPLADTITALAAVATKTDSIALSDAIGDTDRPLYDSIALADLASLEANIVLTDNISFAELLTLVTALGIEDTLAFLDNIANLGRMVFDEFKLAELGWRLQGYAILGTTILPHVLSIKVTDPATMTAKNILDDVPRHTIVGKMGRLVEVKGWTKIDDVIGPSELNALADGTVQPFMHPNGEGFSVRVLNVEPDEAADQYGRVQYKIRLQEVSG